MAERATSLEDRVRALAWQWREAAKSLRARRGAGPDGQMDEYYWNKEADTFDAQAQALEDLL